ncbi:hypothetical protein [Symmachiella dynata]|nr:hypothetical protein [Symmachiella dynata]
MRQNSSNKTLQSPDFSTEYNPQVVFLKKLEEPLALAIYSALSKQLVLMCVAWRFVEKVTAVVSLDG